MKYFECIEKSNKSMDNYKKVTSKRPKKLEDTPKVREYCIKDLKAHLTMLIDIKDVVLHRDIKSTDRQYIKDAEQVLDTLKSNAEVLEKNVNSLEFNTFLDGVDKTDTDLEEIYGELRRIAHNSDDPLELRVAMYREKFMEKADNLVFNVLYKDFSNQIDALRKKHGNSEVLDDFMQRSIDLGEELNQQVGSLENTVEIHESTEELYDKIIDLVREFEERFNVKILKNKDLKEA